MKDKQQEHDKDCPNHRDEMSVDLTMEILTRLPLKSILKFQVVSKTWRSIIRSKDFINSSVSASSMSSSQPLISFKNGQLTNKNAEKCLFFFTTSLVGDESSSLIANLHMTLTSNDAHFYTPCVPINGFTCLSYKGRFMICNPGTRQVITLPEIAGGSTNRYLGYDPVNDQYKAMCRIVSNSKEENQEHMVLTLGGDKKSSWRRIEGNIKNYSPCTKGICINGFLYYGAYTTTANMSRMIVCFDVRSERISFIKPPKFVGALEIQTTLVNYRGKLAIVDFHYHCDFSLWVLQDVMKQEWLMKTSWSVIRWDTRDIPMCHGTTKTGEIIISPKFLSLDRTFYIYYCDLENRNVRRVQIEGVADDEDFRRRYGIRNNGNCYVHISPEHCVNFTFL